MTFWWLDRTLPGVVATAIWALALFVSHKLLRQHIDRVTQRQNEHIEQITSEQTARLSAAAGQPEAPERPL